jgi:hypothetical protein
MPLGFTYTLEHNDRTPADPPTFKTAATSWRPGDTIPLGRETTLRVIEIRPGSDPEDDPVLVVEPVRFEG